MRASSPTTASGGALVSELARALSNRRSIRSSANGWSRNNRCGGVHEEGTSCSRYGRVSSTRSYVAPSAVGMAGLTQTPGSRKSLRPPELPHFFPVSKLTMNPIANSELTLTGSYYNGDSNASGQIPLRVVEAGLISRFGSIDPSEGGNTQRATGRLRLTWDPRPGGTAFANLYLQYYQLDLFSNFTFFLNDPINGDGIEQYDNRYIYGGHVGYRQNG